MKNILVVGGGNAGLISALILKKFLNVNVDIVYSENIGTIGVGEGSTEHFQEFLNFLNINPYSIIKECDATYKSGIMFDGWSNDTYLHSVGMPFAKTFAQYPHVYANLIINDKKYITSRMTWENKISIEHINKNGNPPFRQYHFDTFKLNNFLKKASNLMNINIFEDEVLDVVLDYENKIDYLIGKNKTYNYDFYIDSTGFKRSLIGKLGIEWVSFKKYLKMNSTVTFMTDSEKEFNLWTLAKSMNSGWMFKIPTQNHTGNGYIFSDEYASFDSIKDEIYNVTGLELNKTREFSFDPGYLKNVWIKNCVAVGLSGSFVEPLEATSIGTSIQQSFLLMHKILNYSEKDIQEYNESFKNIMENIRDFICLHYITNKNNSIFWKDIKNIEIPDSLKNNLDLWKNRMPILEDFKDSSQYVLFGPANFIVVMHGLKLFNIKNINIEYQLLSNDIKNDAEIEIFKNIKFENESKRLYHSEVIDIIKNNF